MANTLGYYNPYFYANEALIQLYKALGMASRVHLGYDAERRSFNKGEYVNIRRPGTFAVTDVNTATGGTTADITPESVQVQLSNWKEVKFTLSDKELSFTSERIIEEHIRPAAYALADTIDQALTALYIYVPHRTSVATSTAVAATDLTTVYKTMFNQNVNMNDIDMLNFMVDGIATKDLLDATAFTSWSVAGGEATQNLLRGNLGQRYGFNFFSNQNVKTNTKGTCADQAGAIDHPTAGTYAIGTEMIHVDAMTDGGTWEAGHTFLITGDTQPYTTTAAVTFTGTEADVYISPPLKVAAADGAVVTGGTLITGVENMAFHRDAFALVTAPLSTIGNGLGAQIASVTDPVTGLSLRSRIWYEGTYSSVRVGLDVLYGVKCLQPNLACRMTNIA